MQMYIVHSVLRVALTPKGILRLAHSKLQEWQETAHTNTVVIRTNGISQHQKISCCSLDTHDPKMIDISFESPECKL